MSIQTNLGNFTYEQKQKIGKELEIKMEPKYKNAPTKYVYPFEVVNDNLIIPFAYGVVHQKIKRPPRDAFPSMNVNFVYQARPEQKELLDETTNILNKKGSIMISAYTGFGKTFCAIKLASTIKLKTLIIVNKIVLIKQWEESIKEFCDSDVVVQKLTAKSDFSPDADFYIMNAQNIEKMGRNFFRDIGLVIVDEAHLIMAETLSKSMQYIYPRYLIGLTATPYRPDGLDILLELYFGKHKIIRKLYREHDVLKVETGFKPTIEYAINGKVNWGVLLDSQANDDDRNELIIGLIKHFPTRNFLVLTKRISQGEYLIERLTAEGESVTSLLGKNQEFDRESRILVGTSSKVGVGFDHVKLDALLLAADIEEYFIQYLGRVFRTKDSVPLIIDLVDKYCILQKHWNTRRSVYQEHGGTVRTFDLENLY